MTNKLFTKKMVENLIYYGLCLLAVGVTPFLAKPIAPLFDWAGYSLMRPFFVDVFTIIFWIGELVGLRYLKKKWNKEKEEFDETGATSKKKEKPPLLPMRNVLILSAISVVCIFIASAQIGFKVKPIYEIGEKVTGYEIVNKLGMLGRNIVKCVWILLSLHALHEVASEMLISLPENKKKWLLPIVTGACLLLFWGLDILVFERFFMWTYLLFYVAFTAVYYLTERNTYKAVLLIILIYLF